MTRSKKKLSRPARQQPAETEIGRVRLPAGVTVSPSAYGMLVRGACCEPEIPDGAVVIVEPGQLPEVGEFACLYPKIGQPMVKRLANSQSTPIAHVAGDAHRG
jgi:SOS-response transcriptional repressor LexA